ncbi:hypothetical protein [Pedobacter miscanthi]|uniref:GIY-YIG domain-containing protein n=1 Tax=Pedobacter miscanthi TaxID=2259170 RepID=A0A366KPV8_9SPHI|nr:hypothetical protein [Pedobacter miscanthi]RBQ02822.1 hypothetical protein DRW42_24540 [Pedobacter miscanthi]
MEKWSTWKSFPNPHLRGRLTAPVGYGVYQLRNKDTKELILFGRASNVASRLCSLLPIPFGKGTRRSEVKKQYVFLNLESIEYRTIAFDTQIEAVTFERSLRKKFNHIFNT